MKLRVHTVFLFIFFSISFFSLQAQRKTEALYNKVLEEVKKASPQDQVDLLTRASHAIRKDDIRRAVLLSKRAVKIADAEKVKQGQAYASLGSRQINDQNYEAAIESFKKAAAFNQAQADKNSLAKNYEALGHCYENLLRYDLALSYFQKFLKLEKELKDDKRTANANRRIGIIYYRQKDFRKALNAFQLALAGFNKTGQKTNAKDVKERIALCQKRLANPTQVVPSTGNIKMVAFEEENEVLKDSLEQILRLYQETTNQLQATQGENLAQAELINEQQDEISNQALLIRLEQQKRQQERREFILYLSIALLAAVALAVISLLTYRNNRQKRRSNKELSVKNDEIMAEKQKSDELLLNILPAKIADELKARGKVVPQEYQHATMLFTDFRGFTRIAASLPADQLIAELNMCFEAFDDICDRHQLEKIKTIGDAYMAVGGVPERNTTHPEDAVRAALEMQQYMQNWKKEKISRGEPYWELRVGIHTGSVIAGVIGKHKFAYDIWGDAVNVASRMESSGEAWQVNISQQTYDRVKDKFACEHRGKIPIKHKGPVDMYFVKGTKG
jgi:adenylate cyclase